LRRRFLNLLYLMRGFGLNGRHGRVQVEAFFLLPRQLFA
jgi:hypothetical protein